MDLSMSRFWAWAVAGIFGVWLIAACNVHIVQHPLTPSPSGCHVIQHNLGESCIPHKPQRIVTLSLATLGNVLALGVKPIGTTNEFYQENYSTSFKGQAAGIKIVGNSQPNLESVLRLKPDLILGIDWSSNIYPTLSQIAPTVMGALYYPEWKKYFHFVAEVLGKQDAEKSAWDHYYQRIQQLKVALGDRYQDKKISFVHFYSGGIGIVTVNSFAGDILKDAGLERPAPQNMNAPDGLIYFSLEELDKADGDVIFVGIFADGGNQVFNQIQKNRLWKKLKAVQTKQVYYVDVASWFATHMLATDAVINDLFKYLVNTP
jgi:iron complex transport system substrate-binding protein